jgi:pyruvate-ferredoxin/flavodoxin oxidoreductase
MLRSLAGADAPSREEIEAEVRDDVAGRIASGLMQLAAGESSGLDALAGLGVAAPPQAAAAAPTSAGGDYMAPWIDTDQCTACDECTNLNSKIFAYNDSKKAVITNPTGGPYKDIVKAAERCTARVIHPGLPANRSPKDIDKWIKRGQKYN